VSFSSENAPHQPRQNRPTRWPPYQCSPVARSRRPTWPDGGSSRWQRGHTGSITRRHTPVTDFTVSAHRPGAGRPQKMHFTARPRYARRHWFVRGVWHSSGWCPPLILVASARLCVAGARRGDATLRIVIGR